MATHDAPLTIVGNALAGMVAATERARRGLRTVVVNPGGPWGGYFAGVAAGGQRWDLGTVLCEFTSFRTPATPPALAGYDATRRNDVGRYTTAVRDYIGTRHATRDIAPMQMWTGERWLPDLMLGNGLDALAHLPCADVAREELRTTLATAERSRWHASRKDDWPANGTMGYDDVSRINHGSVLHEAVFAPFARQVMNHGGERIAALFHRIPWLPLYWPLTLLAALEGRPTGLAPTFYSHPVGASVADMCAALAAEMRAEPLIHLHEDRLLKLDQTPRQSGRGSSHRFTLHFERGGQLSADRLAWAQTPRQALAACGSTMSPAVEERLPLLLVLLRVPREALRREFSVVHAMAPDTGLYRVTNVSHCAGDVVRKTEHAGTASPLGVRSAQLAIEAHPERFAARHGATPGDAELVQALLRDLVHLGLIAAGTQGTWAHVLRLPGALPLPTPAAMAAYAREREAALHHLPGVTWLGASAGPCATSLSDQIVQGLQLAQADDGRDAIAPRTPRRSPLLVPPAPRAAATSATAIA